MISLFVHTTDLSEDKQMFSVQTFSVEVGDSGILTRVQVDLTCTLFDFFSSCLFSCSKLHLANLGSKSGLNLSHQAIGGFN